MRLVENVSHYYRVFLIALFKIIAMAMILVGILITLCIVADKIFHLGWGYPWWSLLFSLVYIGVAATIYRATPSFVAYIERQVGESASNGNRREKD